MDFGALDRTAARQHGLVTKAQLTELGAGRGLIRSHVATGRLERLRTGVYRVGGAPMSREQAVMAAVLEAGPGVVVSHHTAAWLWGLRGFAMGDRIDLMTLRERPRTRGVRGHTTAHLPDSDRTRLRGIPVTTAERSLVDASGAVHPWVLRRVIDDGVRRKILSYRKLERCFADVPVSGRRPSQAMREALKRRPSNFDPGGSAAELGVLEVLIDGGVDPLPEQQFRVEIEGRRYRLDFAWPATYHAIEFDHSGFHDNPSSFHDDRERLRRLARAGWTVWPVTERTGRQELLEIGWIATGTPPA